jgi:subtilisin family serine protease
MPNPRCRRPRATAWPAALTVAALVVTMLAPAVRAGGPTTATPLAGARPAAGLGARRSLDGEILVRYARSTTSAQRDDIAREHGLTRLRSTPDGLTDIVTAPGRATTTVRRTLGTDPRVVAVAPNQQRDLADDASAEPDFGDLWGLHNTGQTLVGTSSETGVANVDIDGLQALRSGMGNPAVVVAVIDDGVDFSHPDLAARAWTNPGEAGPLAANGIDDDGNGYVDDVNGWDFCNQDNTVHDAGRDGHGTHVAGTIAASLDGQGTVGVAPGIRVMALKFIDNGGACGSDDMAVAAIDYAASFGVPIINASWGGPQPSSVLDAAIGASNALFVAAAGNGGLDLDAPSGPRFYPASSALVNVLAVTAVDQSGRLASFSNFGTTSVDLAAPGTNILSTYPASADCPTPCYAWSAGTSMAAPHVSGVAALAGSHQPALLTSPILVRGRLLATGRPLATTDGRTSTGRLVNAMRAIDAGKPTVHAADRYGFAVGSVIGSRSIRTYVRWPAAADALTGVAGYDVRRLGPDGWTDVARGVTGLSARSSIRYGGGYLFRLRATDRAGNVGGPADGPVVTATLHSDATSLATYGPGWSTVASRRATGGRLHTSYKGGSWMTFSFTGRSVALVAPKGASRGDVKVYVDGAYVSTVSLYRSSAISQVVVFAQAWPTKAAHTIKLVVAGTPGHSRVDVDGFVVIR